MKSKLWLKATSIILFVVLTAVLAASVLLAAFCIYEEVYFDGGKSFVEGAEEDMLLSAANSVKYDYIRALTPKGFSVEKDNAYRGDVWEFDTEEYKFKLDYRGVTFESDVDKSDLTSIFGYKETINNFNDEYSRENFNYPFAVYDQEGSLLSNNFLPDPGAKSETLSFKVESFGTPEHLSLQFDSRYKLEAYLENSLSGGIYNSEIYFIPQEGFVSVKETPNKMTWCLEADYIPIETQSYELMIYYPETYRVGYQASEHEIMTLIVQYRYLPFILAIPCAIGMVVIFIYLICAAGHKAGVDGITPNFIDKIPFDLYLAILVAIVLIEFGLLDELWTHDLIMLIVGIVFAVITLLLLIGLVMTLATRAKLGTVFKNTLVWKIIVLLYKVIKTVVLAVVRLFKKLFGAIGHLFKNIPLHSRAATIGALLFIAQIILIILGYNFPLFFFVWIFVEGLLLCYAAFQVVAFSKVKTAAKKLARGESDTKVKRDYLFGDFTECADYLDGIGDGINKAVAEKIKSERLKTELITNVSHDLKTPLTSIVNYVDILSKQDIQPEEAKEYVDVLVRQSQRMKKLIDDLIEASKASSGATKVELQRSDLSLLLTQATAEYEERFKSADLTLKMSLPEAPLVAYVDGKLMWRVFDNLLGNIVKYTQPATRVYVLAEEVGDNIQISFKNISKFELNISEDELMERFKRGDSSRSTEGSGLGLSIAQSLCILQNSKLDIEIDGDLFKAMITVPKASDDEIINA